MIRRPPRSTLFPTRRSSDLPALFDLPLDGREVIRFARRVGVSPGIIVGQLQHYGRIKHNQLNSLKRRSEEHTSELQSLAYLVCRLLLEKKKNKQTISCYDTH